MNTREIANQIYDTLMENVGMSNNHVKFEPEKVTNQETYHHTGLSLIYVEIENHVFEVAIKEVASDYFNEE